MFRVPRDLGLGRSGGPDLEHGGRLGHGRAVAVALRGAHHPGHGPDHHHPVLSGEPKVHHHRAQRHRQVKSTVLKEVF